MFNVGCRQQGLPISLRGRQDREVCGTCTRPTCLALCRRWRLGMALRPVDASRHGIQQPLLPIWMLLEAVACVLIYKAMCHKAWEDLYQPQEMMEMLLTFVTVPWPCFKQALLRRQLRLQRVVLLGRSIATIGTVAAVAVKYGSVVPNGVCPLALRPARFAPGFRSHGHRGLGLRLHDGAGCCDLGSTALSRPVPLPGSTRSPEWPPARGRAFGELGQCQRVLGRCNG